MKESELYNAWIDEEREARIANSKLGSVLAIILMPLGSLLDYFVYPNLLTEFLRLRLGCSLLVGVVLTLFFTPFGKRFYKPLSMLWYLLPALAIAIMIYQSGDPTSPYYAGLNIVLLGVGLILPWTYKENLAAALLVILMYGATYLSMQSEPAQGPTLSQGRISQEAAPSAQSPPSEAGSEASDSGNRIGLLFNNLYFLGLTALIVVVGSYSHNRMRFREFSLRYEVEANRRTLEENNRKLVELDQLKSRFFANVSHELRTPLTLLLTPLESLLREGSHKFDTETQELLATMHTNGMRLLKLINDLLDLVRMDSGSMKIKREPVDLIAFVRGIINSVNKTAEDKGVKLDSTIPLDTPRALLDRDKLEKVLLNLVFNALKFTPQGGRVHVHAQIRQEELTLHVTDTGMGISREGLSQIFDRFWQADTSAQRKYQGTGIGLALVKELTEIQGGRVDVDSELGRGTRFSLFIPCETLPGSTSETEESSEETDTEETEEQPEEKERQLPQPDAWLKGLYRRAELFPAMTSVKESVRPVETSGFQKRPPILIADDEPDMLRFLKSRLHEQYAIVEAVDGLQATEKACQFLPQLILLDMMMPEKDGLQVCRELRAHTPTESIPIILLTARADEETKLSGLDAGANDFLTKPFSLTELHLRIRNLIASRRLEQELARQNQRLEATLEELKETETQLVQTEKLASLGRLSAGIIHEINNPLNYSKTGLYTLRSFAHTIPEDERGDYEELLGDVEQGIDRIKTIVSDLRTFTRPDNHNFDEVQVAPLVEAALRFLSHEWKDKVEIHTEIPEEATLWGNRNLIIQVLVNLLQNALDSLMEKEFDKAESPAITLRWHKTSNQEVLAVRDNGNGVPDECLPNIFDPFFTSKDVGQGMGLGLSICYRIMTQHGGTVHVDSQPGQYAEFSLVFPGHNPGSANHVTYESQDFPVDHRRSE